MDTTHFEKLPLAKQQTILSAGILCFGRSGYEKTAISEIAKEAGISKAAVFHYFGTKEDLFMYLVQYARQEVELNLPESSEDFFETMTMYITAHFKLVKKHPGMYDFLLLVNDIVAKQSFEPMNKLSEGYQEKNLQTIFAKVDWSKFKEGYDPITIVNLTTWIGTGFLSQMGQTLPLEEVQQETERYLSILRQALYKPE